MDWTLVVAALLVLALVVVLIRQVIVARRVEDEPLDGAARRSVADARNARERSRGDVDGGNGAGVG
jgi:hypothetical protein